MRTLALRISSKIFSRGWWAIMVAGPFIALSGPSPATTSGIAVPNLSQAWNKVRTPFSSERRPAKKRVSSVATSGPRIRRHKIRLHHNSFRRKPARDQFLAGEFAGSNVGIHHAPPRSAGSMDREHGSHCRSCGTAATVTTVDQRRKRDASDTLFTYGTISQQSARRTDQTVIVQRLNDGHIRSTGGIVTGWRNQWKGVVEMRHIARLFSQHGTQTAKRPIAPYRASGCGNSRAGDAAIMLLVADYRVTVLLQQSRFIREHAVLTPGLPVEIVDAEDCWQAHVRHISCEECGARGGKGGLFFLGLLSSPRRRLASSGSRHRMDEMWMMTPYRCLSIPGMNA